MHGGGEGWTEKGGEDRWREKEQNGGRECMVEGRAGDREKKEQRRGREMHRGGVGWREGVERRKRVHRGGVGVERRKREEEESA